MAGIYASKNAKVSVISGKVTAVGADKKSFSVESQEYLFEKKERQNKTFDFKLANDLMVLADDVEVGKFVTIMGYEKVSMGMMEEEEESQWVAGYVSVGNESFDFKQLSVVNGDVVFARYNDEIGEDGKPNMKPERMGPDGQMIPAKARVPHFDVGVSVIDKEGNRVLHIIKAYPDPIKDKDGKVVEGKKNFDKIETYKKRFGNFDKETNPMRVTIVTQPGTYSSSTREYNGNTYENHYCNHMGIRFLDIEYLREKAQEKTSETKSEVNPEVKAGAKVEDEVTQPNNEVNTTPANEEIEDDMNGLFSIN